MSLHHFSQILTNEQAAKVLGKIYPQHERHYRGTPFATFFKFLKILTKQIIDPPRTPMQKAYFFSVASASGTSYGCFEFIRFGGSR